MDEALLFGSWSNDTLYDSAMEDELLFFGQSGEGVYEWSRPGVAQGAVFTWTLDGDRLTTRTAREFSNYGGSSATLRRGGGVPFDYRDLRISFTSRFDSRRREDIRVLIVHYSESSHTDAWPTHDMDFGYVRPDCRADLREQLERAHSYFDPRGGLPRP